MLPRSFDAWRLGIEPVHDPAGVLPAELDGESKNQRLDHACWRQIVQRPMAELRHREDMGEIKEQFLMGDVRMARRHAAAGVNDDRRCLPLSAVAPVNASARSRQRKALPEPQRQRAGSAIRPAPSSRHESRPPTC